MSYKRPNNGTSRKRGYDSVDDRSDRNSHPPRHPHRRQEEPAFPRLRRLLFTLIDKPKADATKEAHYVATKLHACYDDPIVRDSLCKQITNIVVDHPPVIPVLAAVLLHANDLNSEIADATLKATAHRLNHEILMGKWTRVKLLLRFLACLQCMIADDGIITLLNTLFLRAADLQEDSPEDTFGFEIVKIILLTLPYLIASAPIEFRTNAAELLEQTAVIASAPPATFQDIVKPYIDSKEEHQFKPLLQLLQDQLTNEAKAGWTLKVVPRLYEHYKSHSAKGAAGEEAEPTDTTQTTSLSEIPPVLHSFPQVEIPSKLNQGNGLFFLQGYFSLYDNTEVESVPSSDNIASTLIRDVLVDSINILDFSRIWVSESIVEIDKFWPAGTFAPRKSQLDALKTFKEEGKPTWKSEDMIIDAIFSQIMLLPTPPHKLVYYHSLITEACKVDPAAIAPSLGRAIRFFYRNIEFLDRELEYRFMDWFAHHLSNFDFRWKWEEWTSDLELSDIYPAKSFLVGIFDKQVRLSFPQRIRKTLSIEFWDMVPEGKDEDMPKFKYADSDVSYVGEARQLLQLVKKKGPEDEIRAVTDTIREKAVAEGKDGAVTLTDVYMSSILVVGSKSLSHVLSAIERHKDFLLAVSGESEEAKQQIISSVFSYWNFRPGTAVGIVDKLLNYTIVSPSNVVEWSLGPKNLGRGSLLASAWLYEMVSATMLKVTTRVRQIRDAIIQSKVNLAPESEIEAIEDMFRSERDSMSGLFRTIQDHLRRVSSGQAESEWQASVDESAGDAQIIESWANRWQKVFDRRFTFVNLAVGDRGLQLGIDLEESVRAAHLAERRARENASRFQENEADAKVDLDHAAVTANFDPTNGMDCDSGPGSANVKMEVLRDEL